MPSVVRRVRAQLLGQPEPGPAEALPPLPPVGRPARSDTAGDDAAGDACLSLPLPAKLRRPPLPQGVHAAADSTVSLPLPPAQPRPALQQARRRGASTPGSEAQPLMAAEDLSVAGGTAGAAGAAGAAGEPQQQQAAEGPAAEGGARLRRASGTGLTGASTLSKTAAAQLGQQLWRQLQSQRYLGEHSAAVMESVTEGVQMPGGGLQRWALQGRGCRGGWRWEERHGVCTA